MNSKTLFNKQKELRDKLNAVVKSDWFSEAMIYVRASLMERPGLTPAGIDGARAFEHVLLEFTDEENAVGHFPSPGLEHDLEPRKPTPDKPTE